jgi:effector-binding domain-containing protein
MEVSISSPTIIVTAACPTASIHLTIPGRDMPKYMDPAIQEILKALSDQSLHPVGPMFSFHHRRPTDTFDFELGFPIARTMKETGRVKNSTLPAERVARAVYQGPYEGLRQAWPALMEWVHANGHIGTGRFWEAYLNNPNEVKDESEYRTGLNMILG